jgi:hypothetical protein
MVYPNDGGRDPCPVCRVWNCWDDDGIRECGWDWFHIYCPQRPFKWADYRDDLSI